MNAALFIVIAALLAAGCVPKAELVRERAVDTFTVFYAEHDGIAINRAPDRFSRVPAVAVTGEGGPCLIAVPRPGGPHYSLEQIKSFAGEELLHCAGYVHARDARRAR